MNEEIQNSINKISEDDMESYHCIFQKNKRLGQKLCYNKRNMLRDRNSKVNEIYKQLELHKYHTFHVHEIVNIDVNLNHRIKTNEEKNGVLDIYMFKDYECCNKCFIEKMKQNWIVITLESIDLWIYLFSIAEQKIEFSVMGDCERGF